MFKRANKITSLLVAAAAVASMVPAYASDVKKVESQDGTVYNAVAYNGKFYVDAEINDKEAAYYLDNGKYNEISDVDSGSDVETYGTKYINVNDGDYFIDLTTGKSTDDSIAEDARDDAAASLRKKVKSDTDGRYVKDGLTNAADYLQTFTSSNEIPSNKFGSIWYATKLVNKDATNGLSANTTAGGAGTLNVFTDGSGNYIDADYNLGKVKVTTTAAGVNGEKSVYIENTDDTYDTGLSDYKVSASVAPKAVGTNGAVAQDKDYIYRLATVTVEVKYTGSATPGTLPTIKEIEGKDVSTATAFQDASLGGRTKYTFDVIQKISKTQSSSDIGGAKYAKIVNTYVISNDSGVTKSFGSFGGSITTQYTVSNGKLIAYALSGGQVYAQTATLKSENGLYYTDLGSATSGDDAEAVQVDVNGNVYRLNGGYIYQWNNDEDWDKIYKVDGSFDKFSVYDKDNIVAWNQDDEVYSVIGAKKADDTKKDDPKPVVAGWAQNADGTWSVNKADGTKATGWYQDGGNWYYLDQITGTMTTGWKNVNGTWFYLNPISDGTKGAMKTGWVYDNGSWYYLNPVSDGTRGAMRTGWINDNGTWYYCNGSGAMLANTTVGGYVLGSNGAWIG